MHQGKLCDPLSVVMLWSGSASICDGALLREGLFVELRPQAGPLYPDSRLQRRAWESHTVIHMLVPTCSHTLGGGKKNKETQTLIHTLI